MGGTPKSSKSLDHSLVLKHIDIRSDVGNPNLKKPHGGYLNLGVSPNHPFSLDFPL